MITFQGEPDQVRATASKTVALSDELQGLLGRMRGAQEALRTALVSPGAGTAAQNSLTNAGAAGDKLTLTQREIADALNITASTTEDQDIQAASQVNAAASGDSKVDTQTWA